MKIARLVEQKNMEGYVDINLDRLKYLLFEGDCDCIETAARLQFDADIHVMDDGDFAGMAYYLEDGVEWVLAKDEKKDATLLIPMKKR